MNMALGGALRVADVHEEDLDILRGGYVSFGQCISNRLGVL